MTDRLSFELPDPAIARSVYGLRDENLRTVGELLTVDVHVRDTRVTLEGDPVDIQTAEAAIRQLYALSEQGHIVDNSDIRRIVEIVAGDREADVGRLFKDTILHAAGNKTITPKTPTQQAYVKMIRTNDVVFGTGPAGTGKTYLAMACAVAALQQRKVRKIILTRPAVEAGERLGFLPGDLHEKVSPYLRPLYDALFEMVGSERAAHLAEKGVIEVAPLAFMRGRTLNGAFVILDEAQNTTREQMKMFLTRLGADSCAVITGDVSQVDLPRNVDSGLRHALSILQGVPGIGVTTFSQSDVVRHPLVRRIIAAYEADNEANR
jgi:phosphate starvation-inducible PhoH-like protein